MFGPAIVGGYIAYPESGIIERTSALFPLWLDQAASYWKVSHSTAAYVYVSSVVMCALWAVVAILLLARARYARIALFGLMALALLYPIIFRLLLGRELRLDTLPYDTVVLCVLLAIIFTRPSVRGLFAREDG